MIFWRELTNYDTKRRRADVDDLRNVPIIWSIFPNTKGEEIGANILPIETIAGVERMIGNIVIKSQEFGDIVGYENHSG